MDVTPIREAARKASRDIEDYLARHERKDMLRLLTAGSVDDGKSTLIGRLLVDSKQLFEDQIATLHRDSSRAGKGADVDYSLLLDGLRAEREQGITIDVAYRFFSTDRRSFIIADTPGHEQYTRNMATGASTCDLAILLVDARLGISTQTRRHSYIVSLLGIRHVVVAINKMDLVGYDEAVFDRIRDDYEELAARLDIPDVTFIPMSAKMGDNVVHVGDAMPWYRGRSLMDHLEAVHISSDHGHGTFRLPVQYVNRPHLDFRGFCGTVAAGVVRPGDEVMALPSGRRSRVAEVLSPDGPVDAAYAMQPVTLTLEDEIDISRGDVLTHIAEPPSVCRRLEATVVWMVDEPLVPGREYLVKLGTRTAPCTVTSIAHRVCVDTYDELPAGSLALNEIGRVQLQLARPMVFDPYSHNRQTGSFILVDRDSNATCAAGMVARALHETETTSLPVAVGQYGRELEVARAVARAAGAAVAVYARWPANLWSADKADDLGPQTLADIGSSALITRCLEAVFPDDVVVSEEEPDDRSRLGADRVWLVDPLDGTRGFQDGRGDEYCVAVSLLERRGAEFEPVVGVVYAPGADSTWFAVAGGGAWKQQGSLPPSRVRVTHDVPLARSLVMTSRYHQNPSLDAMFDDMGRPRRSERGSLLRAMAVAEGSAQADLHPHPLMEWDLAAAAVICREAGARVTAADGSALRWNTADARSERGALIAPPTLHAEIGHRIGRHFE